MNTYVQVCTSQDAYCAATQSVPPSSQPSVQIYARVVTSNGLVESNPRSTSLQHLLPPYRCSCWTCCKVRCFFCCGSVSVPLTRGSETSELICLGWLLVGYGLSKDLAALDVQHPTALQKDLIRCSKFQNRSGQAHRLQDVANQFLGHAIQQGKHSARWVRVSDYLCVHFTSCFL